MGKCVSKHPSVLTIALSEKDLAAANHIWSKFAESTEYIALKDEHGNQLCEYYYVSGKKRKAKPKTTKQQLAPTNGDNDANTTTVGATRPAAQTQHSNENQNQRQQQSQKKGRNKRRLKTAQKQSSTQQSSENKSQQWTTNSEQTTNTNSTVSYTKRLQQDCVTSQAESSALAADGLTTTTATTSTIVYGSVSGCEYCTVVSTTDDDDESEGEGEDANADEDRHDDSDDGEQLFGIHNHNNATEAIVVDNTNKETAVGAHKNQQHCVAHLPSQPQEQIAGDTVAPDANNNAEIAAKHEEYAYQPKWQQQRLVATEKGQLISSEVSKVNIGVTGVENAAELDNVDGNSERLSGSEHLTVEGSDYLQGQAESKRHSKKHGSTTNATAGTGVGAIETKGTAMSFGFRKKLNTTPKKFKKLLEAGVGGMTGGGDGKRKQDKCNNITTTTRDGNTPSEDNAKRATVIDSANYGETLTDEQQQDDNGNAVKRRSKSAHAGRALTSGDETSESGSCSDAAGRPKITQPKSITFNLSQNSTIEYQRRQFFEQPNTYGSYGSGRSSAANIWTHQPAQQHQSRNVISTGMHTNVIVRPTPRAPPASFSKFTLHTVSLPKPEFPVAISVGATTPTTPGSIYTPSPTMATSVAGARTKENQQQQHPLTVVACATVTHSASGHMDLKTAKQMANNTRRGFSGSREISADSGIASMDMALDSSVSSGGGSRAGRTASPKRSRSRPRNLQMVMNGRHKFEVRDLDDPLSSESSSIVEPLALPKLPSENQTVPLPLCGLVRSNTVLSRETYERNGGVIGNRSASANPEIKQVDIGKRPTTAPAQCTITRNSSEESEGVDEEKLYLDRSTSEKGNRFKDINTCSSKTSSPGSSIMLSWCNAGESLAVKDCSSLSISSEDSNKLHGSNHQDKDTDTEKKKFKHMSVDLNDDDLSGIVTEMQISTLSSLTDNLANENNNSGLKTVETNTVTIASTENTNIDKPDRPKSFYNTLNETKFAEMALAGSTYLLDDETSPTDSLVSSTESEEAASKQKKHKINEELQEKDIDEISPELEMGSPISPGTPTHASHSLSLSDCGNLIDDEIADQPALLFNSEAHDLVDSLTSHKDKTETPTLMENTGSMRSLKSQSKARTALQQAIELSLRTPLSLRKAVMERADSLDTLSPCESICSDDLMMDFDMHSSVDSIDRSGSIKSRSGSDLHKIDDTELFSELERKGSDVMKELNSLLRLRTNKSADKDVDIAHLPARATRLLNRSRLQQQQYPSSLASGVTTNAATGSSICGGGGDSDSSKSAHSLRRSAAASRASNASTSSTNASLPPSSHYHHQKPFQHHYSQLHRDSHSSSDDLMLYDKSFRNAMIQDVLQFKKQLLRLRRILQDTETLNPFDNDNGQLFAACGLDSKLLDDMDLASLTSSTTDDPMMELADLRRQVVYLQGEVEDRERTIRLQKNQIENLESKKPPIQKDHTKELMNIATQTERTRPLSYGLDGLSSVTTHPDSQLQSTCGCTEKTLHFFNYLKTKIPRKHFAPCQILITSIPTATQRFFIIIHRKLQHFKDNFGGIVIGCLNGFAAPSGQSDECGGGGGDVTAVGSSPSCLSRSAGTLQRLAASACGTLVRFTRCCTDLHSWRFLLANCRQLSCNILTCYNSNCTNCCNYMHHHYCGLVARSQDEANWLDFRVRSAVALLASNIFCFFHHLQRILP